MYNFYHDFTERFRGKKEDIKARLKVYKPLFKALDHLDSNFVVDIGCGRGEWLEILKENNVKYIGVDTDEGMYNFCSNNGLNVLLNDAIEYLQSLAEESVGMITGFHIIEHLTLQQKLTLINEAYRVLVPGGILILETPNPENILVSTNSFYYDPTHITPVPYQVLEFFTEYSGFAKNFILFLNENSEIVAKDSISLFDVLFGVSPDYAIIAQKGTNNNSELKIEELIDVNKGLKLHELTDKYDLKIANLKRSFDKFDNLLKNLHADIWNTKNKMLFQRRERAKSIPDSVEELLEYDNEDFIVKAYQFVLGRTPDPSGASFFSELLAKGESKLIIIANLAFSPEGKAKNVKIKGLYKYYIFSKFKKIPLIGGLLEFVTYILRLPVIIKELRGTIYKSRQLEQVYNELICAIIDNLHQYVVVDNNVDDTELNGIRPNNKDDKITSRARRILHTIKKENK